MGTPLVKAEQDRAIRVEDLPEVVVGGRRLRLAKERLVPFAAASHIAYPDDRPRALHLGHTRSAQDASKGGGYPEPLRSGTAAMSILGVAILQRSAAALCAATAKPT